MAKIFISERSEEIVVKIRKAMHFNNEVSKWVMLRLAFARSLAIDDVPRHEDYPVGSNSTEYNLEQVTGLSKDDNDLIDRDYTDHFITLITEHAGKKLNRNEAYKYLQTHISRGLMDIGRSFKEGENIFEYLYQELFFPLEKSSKSPDISISSLLSGSLSDLNLECNIEEEITKGARFITYLLKPASGIRLKDFTKASDEIEIKLGQRGIIIEQAPSPGYLYIHVPKKKPQTIHLMDMINSKEFEKFSGELPAFIGQGINGNPFFLDLAKTPHLFVGGATGSGKSKTLHALLLSLLYKANDRTRLMVIDPKRVEMRAYKEFSSLICPPLSEINEIRIGLEWSIEIMEERYKKFESMGVRDIAAARDKDKSFEYLVIVIDEFGDLILQDSGMQDLIGRIAQMGRAAGIHLILATQRPDANTFSGIIRTNTPSRIALKVQRGTESKIILDEVGAELLFGRGDMLVKLSDDTVPTRVQGALINEENGNDFSYVKKKLPSHLSHNDDLMNRLQSDSDTD